MQPVDFTTLTAACHEIRDRWLPARLEQVYQRDRHTVQLALRTLSGRGWLTVSWHPQAARVCLESPPPRTPDTFTFSQQLRHQVGGLALVAIANPAPWERVLDLQFAQRPGDAPLAHLYVEIMGKRSNVILVNQEGLIVTAAYQVSPQQSSVRPVQTGQPYEAPPRLTDPMPNLEESPERWRERIALIPGPVGRNLLRAYQGLSSALVASMVHQAGLDPDQSTEALAPADWDRLFQQWLGWLKCLETGTFLPGWTATGYTVMGWQAIAPVDSVQHLLQRYYGDRLNQQVFQALRHQISQRLKVVLAKLGTKRQTFEDRLAQSDGADTFRAQADLLMAHLHEWTPGLKAIALADFETGEPVTIPLDPEKNAVQNAQALYKKHQKLRRARAAVEPLLAEVYAEIAYLEEVETAIAQIESYASAADLQALEEIREELIQQGYMADTEYRSRTDGGEGTDYHRYTTPSGFEVLVGRNNRQNDQLTFRVAGDYDLWFHTQEIPGSHVLLRLEPGTSPEEADLQFVADVAAYHSRARQSDQAPVVYTEPKNVYKPRGAKPGTVIYKRERILWGRSQIGATYERRSP